MPVNPKEFGLTNSVMPHTASLPKLSRVISAGRLDCSGDDTSAVNVDFSIILPYKFSSVLDMVDVKESSKEKCLVFNLLAARDDDEKGISVMITNCLFKLHDAQ